MKKNKTWLFIIALLVVLIVILWGVGRKKGVFRNHIPTLQLATQQVLLKYF